MTSRLFALEHYDRSGGRSLPDSAALAAAVGACLVGVFYLSADEVVLALVRSSDPQALVDTAAHVGWRVDRLTEATWIAPPLTPGW